MGADDPGKRSRPWEVEQEERRAGGPAETVRGAPTADETAELIRRVLTPRTPKSKPE